MIIRWIIIGSLMLNLAPVSGQISLQRQAEIDSLLLALDTARSNYRTLLIADELLQLMDSNRVSRPLYDIYRARGLSQSRSGYFSAALGSQQKAFGLAQELQDSFLIAQSTYSIGSILYNQKQYDLARQHFQDAEEIFARLDSLRWLAYVYNAYGLLERENQQWDAALNYYRQTFELLSSSRDHQQLVSIPLNNMGDVYFNQEKYSEALSTFRQSLALARQLGRSNDIAIAYFNIGECHRELKQYETAFQYLHRGLRLARQEGFKEVEAVGLKSLFETYEQLEKPDSALSYLKAYVALQDTLQQSVAETRFEELYLAYAEQRAQNEMTHQKQEIDTLKQEKKLNQLSNYFIISLLILALALSSFLVIRYRMKRKLAESQLLNQKLEAKEIRRELEGKQKDLTNLALEIARKNELFNRTNETISEIDQKELSPEQRQKIRQLIQFNTKQLQINEDLEELLLNIEQVNADFFEKLQRIAPELTPYEKQLCALFRLNLSNKDIASIRNISPKSVEMARYRLRKKLPLKADDDLYTFIQKI